MLDTRCGKLVEGHVRSRQVMKGVRFRWSKSPKWYIKDWVCRHLVFDSGCLISVLVCVDVSDERGSECTAGEYTRHTNGAADTPCQLRGAGRI